VVEIDTMFFVIIGRGKANAILRKAQDCGATGGTIFLGEGTAHSKFLDAMGLSEIQKEILMISASHELNSQLHEIVYEDFSFFKKNKGIAFSIPLKRCFLDLEKKVVETSTSNVSHDYCCIITIVDKGRSKACLEAAGSAGAKGATLIHGRGAGIPTDYYFPLVIEPQKDIVMIISTIDNAPNIRLRIFADLELEKPGNGIIFTLPVTRVTGLYQGEPEESKEVAT
jgi:hypothetical protein